MDKHRHLLVVDDDEELRELLQMFFTQYNFSCQAVSSGKEMFATLKEKDIDLVILDLMLAREDGLELCKKLRKVSNVPVVMLTAVNTDSERILGLEYGADDYVTKPFNNRELLARVNAILRRVYPAQDEQVIYHFSAWQLDSFTRELMNPQGKLVDLSSGLYELLLAFLEHPQRVLNRDQLLDMTKGRSCEPYDRSIDIQLSRLRTKLSCDESEIKLIKTIRNEGYMLTTNVEKKRP